MTTDEVHIRHNTKVIQEKIREPQWEILPHTVYSSDLAPSDYYLFWSLQNYLNGKQYENDEEIKSDPAAFFASKPACFYKKGIEKFPERWEELSKKRVIT
jgi:histone-lysine N-methyltransferase SETMAR